MYQGEYHGKTKHKPDLDKVLERSWQNGLDKMIITGGSLEDAKKALEVARTSGKPKFPKPNFLDEFPQKFSLQTDYTLRWVVIPLDAMNLMSFRKARKATSRP